jgi:hypothetical protein
MKQVSYKDLTLVRETSRDVSAKINMPRTFISAILANID